MDQVSGSDEPFTEESFFYCCRQVGLSIDDMEKMNIGQCLDHIQEWIDSQTKKPSEKAVSRKATQDDFNNF